MKINKPLIIAVLLIPMILNGMAQNAIPDHVETLHFPKDPPEHWPTYHLLHPGPTVSMPADPNAAFYYKGLYHLHYLYHSEEGGLAMAHVSSPDMVHWTFHPTVLRPNKLGHGMLSGTGFFTKEGRPAIIYSDNKNVMIIYAGDDHLDSWTEPEKVIPKDKKGNVVQSNVWDPDCWL
jgi:sucrose-6-phosphate hydrolase SacC (GH32 family)